jgi:AraC-like DNA-binding protein
MHPDNHLVLQSIRLKASDEWSCKRDGLFFVFIKEGVGRFSSGSVVQRSGPGDVVVLKGPPWSKFAPLDKGSLLFLYFSLSFEQLYPLFGSQEIGRLHDVLDTLKGIRLYAASSPGAIGCHRLVEEVPSQFNLEHRSQLLRVASVILALEFKTAQAQRSGFVRSDEHMIRVFEELSSAEVLGLSVGELAERFGCSRRHLNRLFHQHFGLSVASLRMEMRLLKAAALLRNPEAKVINVAEECGFNHLGLFNTCFKRRFAASPGQWRKSFVRVDVQLESPVGGVEDCPLRANGLCPWGDKKALGGATSQTAAPLLKPGPIKMLPGIESYQQSTETGMFTSQPGVSDDSLKRESGRIRL